MEMNERYVLAISELQKIAEHLLAEQIRHTWVIKTLCSRAGINKAEFDQLCDQADIWRERERLKQQDLGRDGDLFIS